MPPTTRKSTQKTQAILETSQAEAHSTRVEKLREASIAELKEFAAQKPATSKAASKKTVVDDNTATKMPSKKAAAVKPAPKKSTAAKQAPKPAAPKKAATKTGNLNPGGSSG
jgi:chromatin segregation and condensation protein Rec8/ScpA/Scc1 (kleisin family)